jgi:hypothetical protein
MMIIVEEAGVENIEQAQINQEENLETSEAVDNSEMLSKVPQVSHTSCTTSAIPSEDNSLLDHLESHYLGELPQTSFNTSLQTASEMVPEAVASEKIILESPQHHEPEPQKSTSEKASETTPEASASDKVVSEDPPQPEPTNSSPPTVHEHIVPE